MKKNIVFLSLCVISSLVSQGVLFGSAFVQSCNDMILDGLHDKISLGGLGQKAEQKLLFEVGLAYSEKGRSDLAIKYLSRSVGRGAEDFNILLLLAQQYKCKNDYRKALEFFELSLEIKPENVDALFGKAVVLRGLDRYEESVESLSIAAKLSKNPVPIYLELGHTHRMQRKVDKAIESYEKVLKRDFNNISALYHLGFLFAEKKDYVWAIAFYRKVLDLDPGNVDAEFGMSKAYMCQDKGIYQDVVINNVTGKNGDRSCEGRYEFIKDIVDGYNRPVTVLDIGAAEGYLSFRLARKFKDSVFVMIEASRHLFDLCVLNNLSNIVFLNKTISIEELRRLGECEHFDIVLAMSVVHWFGDNWKKAVDAILELGDKILIEVPPVGDVRATGTKDLKNLNDYLFSKGTIALKEFRHTAPGMLSNTYLIERKKDAIKNVHWGRLKDKTSHKIYSTENEKYLIRSFPEPEYEPVVSAWMPGINLMTFKALNGVYPTLKMIENNLCQLKGSWLRDLKIYNLIVQGHALLPIDQDDARVCSELVGDAETGEILRVLKASPENVFSDSRYR
ncbi:tetratricopeptide repeat protein [bacterium]|jgi:tetratricopeptide (TPR) repeat protein|nr:tetratricopeptide repeat protein [bacterium]